MHLRQASQLYIRGDPNSHAGYKIGSLDADRNGGEGQTLSTKGHLSWPVWPVNTNKNTLSCSAIRGNGVNVLLLFIHCECACIGLVTIEFLESFINKSPIPHR